MFFSHHSRLKERYLFFNEFRETHSWMKNGP
ncbi:hypothetical protein I307_03918 [Cryptococcus deuterogattii 99/473]|uniref:Uncharacterized protein n=1 Tax=Cryptococcus deuterogattii Ram5 TaxID=1296110 RepID=A0A0D0SXM3_9TREE|nr:hypothetical protein I309_02755 [Cryptococcus deuterogattii LA55]KIR34931.1 hypothetical protein I352_02186 [Cryptococcus deuterogattii MMRL2647]KIR37927.1 hypothetical protein I313_06300 [Cryptococcus deuterogattii Ram5]KIR70070.1 hypothetical protein I310_06051 [Cryptococcus deuterogattii CA1014]KIR93933.1 hypothetical protein I304_02621 [Cryptococcus deuterogattii CBS 10090]KIS00201.1 hypothetical protein L804_02850 [Cryptococcus deuterogattii 2001/935-1]KIY56807.1 hypothetical protein 